MKSTVIKLSLLSFVLILLLGLASIYTGSRTDGFVDPPVFSVTSGFYPEEFVLEIKQDFWQRHLKDVSIYYSLDGSDPTQAGVLYEGPIVIRDHSGEAAPLSFRDDLSAGFMVHENNDYAYPTEAIDRCEVVRAVAIDNKTGKNSQIITNSYFVGFNQKSLYDNYTIISLVTDPKNLFDYETGIYTTGKMFEDYIASGDISSDWVKWKGNYSGEGRDWERPVEVEIFDKNGNSSFTTSCGIRIKGETSRSYAQKSFNLYARKEYDGNSVFPNGRSCLTLFAGAQDDCTKIYDAWFSDMYKGQPFATLHYYEPVFVFLDGEYWGLYWMTDKYDDEYFEQNFGISENDLVMYRNCEIKIGNDEKGQALWDGLQDAIEAFDPASEADYDELCQLIDMDNCVHYFAAMIYTGRCGDWPQNYSNTAIWRTKSTNGNGVCDGRWRFAMYDLNWGILNHSGDDYLENAIDHSELFSKLCQVESFRYAFIEATKEYADQVFEPGNAILRFAELSQLTHEGVIRDYHKYYGDNRSEANYEKELSQVVTFLKERKEYALDEIYTHWGISVE